MAVIENYAKSIVYNLPVTDNIAFDIGANYGEYTELLSPKFKHVYAFEPNEDNIRILKRNIRNCTNVTIVPIAISNKTGTTKLYMCGNPGGLSISEKIAVISMWGHSPDRYEMVDTITLDDYVKEVDAVPSFIKMDIEAAEDFVWEGAVHTLKNNKLSILLEVHQTVNCAKLFKFFKNLGYKIWEDGKEVSRFEYDHHYLITNIFIDISGRVGLK
jgi:FkbM family methyltransferase